MLGILCIALSVLASPAPAAETTPTAEAAAKPQFTTKKVCRTYEVAGSFIPRRSCVTKKIPIKQAAPETEEAAKQRGAPDGASKEQ